MLFIVTQKLTKQQEDEKEEGGKEEEKIREEKTEEGKFPYAWTCSCSFHRSKDKARTRTVEYTSMDSIIREIFCLDRTITYRNYEHCTYSSKYTGISRDTRDFSLLDVCLSSCIGKISVN